MTNEEAIEVLENGEWWEELAEWYMVVHPEHNKLHDAVDMAISALRQQDHFREVTKKVEPLTLDELREAAQTGDPVWLVRENCSSWVVIEKVGDRKFHPWVDYAEFGSDEPYDFSIYVYGYTFKAYRQKPEEDDHDERKENENV